MIEFKDWDFVYFENPIPFFFKNLKTSFHNLQMPFYHLKNLVSYLPIYIILGFISNMDDLLHINQLTVKFNFCFVSGILLVYLLVILSAISLE